VRLVRVPVYRPDWTDFNRSDPGIALLALFAFLGESLSLQTAARRRRYILVALLVALAAVAWWRAGESDE